MSIYKVDIEYTLYVEADDERNAQWVAGRHVRDATPDCVWSEPVDDIDSVPEKWRDALPWGGEINSTIKESLEDQS